MGWLKKTKKSKFWQIRYVDAAGMERQISSQTEDEARAHKKMRQIEGMIAAGQQLTPKMHRVRFDELAENLLSDYTNHPRSTTGDLKRRLEKHILPVFGPLRAAAINASHIRQYIEMRREEGATNAGINRELAAIKRAFSLGKEEGLIQVLPHIPMLKENNVRQGFLTREQVEYVAAHLPFPVNLAVLFGFLTGWRISEIRGLLWRNVDFKANEIRLDVGSTKNEAGRVFPMTHELRELLLDLRARTATLTPYVFGSFGEFRKTWRTACYKAGLPCTVEPIRVRGHVQRHKDGSVKVKVVRAANTFHDLRRSAVRDMMQRGLREPEIMALVGHKTRSMFLRYMIVSEADLRSAVELLNRRAF